MQTRETKHEAHHRLLLRLSQQAEEIQRLTSDIAEERLKERTVSEKWSVKELLCHIARVQQVFEGRLTAMLDHDNPTLTPYNPEEDAEFEKWVGRPIEELRSGFLRDRERLILRLKSLSPAEWHRPAKHSEYPHYDVHFLIEYMGHHEAHHLYQMFQRRVLLGKLLH